MSYKTLKSCPCCGSTSLEACLKLDSTPLAGHFAKTKDEAINAKIYSFSMMSCDQCGTHFCKESLSVEDIFSDYSYSSSTIPALVNHFKDFSKILETKYGSENKLTLAEVGSNDNVLLHQLPLKWFKIGIDPSNVALNATKRNKPFNSTLLNRPLTTDLIRVANLAGSIDVFTGSNCLAHFEGLQDAFRAIHLALKDGGDFWIEVKDLDKALKINRYTDFYIEHLVSHSVESLKTCLGKIGFNYIDHSILPFHGGLIRALFRKETPTQSPMVNNRKDQFIRLQNVYDNRYDSTLIQKLLSSNNNIAYGASGEANTFFNHFKDINFKYVIDESPLRKGKFIPQVGIPIVGKERLELEDGDCQCLITAFTYKDNIISNNQNFKGQWLTYFPIK